MRLAMWRNLALLALCFSGLAACGGGEPARCGDGTLDPGEECDDGNADDTDFCLSSCRARQLTSLTVKWEFNKNAAEGFTGDACVDLGASQVEVELVGDGEPVLESGSCSFRQVVFFDIPPATYSIRMRVLDAAGAALTTSAVEQEYIFLGGSAETEVTVPPESWSGEHSGTFYFRLAWDGMDCSAGVVNQRLTLTIGGTPYAGMTKTGLPLDGSAVGACQSLTEEFPQSALGVPFGPATFAVQGLDSGDEVLYDGVFETFVGAGVNNPELRFEVEPVPDETADAGVTDAGTDAD